MEMSPIRLRQGRKFGIAVRPDEARHKWRRPPARRSLQANRRRPVGHVKGDLHSRDFGCSHSAIRSPAAGAARNLPLAQSDNERARGLTHLDAKFITDPARMPPAAASYFRQRKFLFPEACQKWRTGYLPRDTAGEDKSGGTMRGRIVYAYPSETGEVLTWFGRDPEFEEKHARWIAGGRSDREPEKFHFVKGFHRGLELFGQHALRDPQAIEQMRQWGLVLVEGSNDVIAVAALGIPAVALCSNTITAEQADKAARLAHELAGGLVTLMLDCDVEGENGVSQVLPMLAERAAVRLAWSSRMHDGRFKARQPESLAVEDWRVIAAALQTR